MEKKMLLSYEKIAVPCKIYEPDFGQVRRVVLGVHSFCTSKEVDIHGGIAEEMAMFGGALACFDFPAHGESTAKDSDLTVDNCIGSLVCVAQMMKDTYPTQEPMCIFASGFGAYITLLALEELRECVGDVRLVIQTPALRMAEVLLGIKGMTREQFREKGKVNYGFDRKIDVSYSFFQEVHSRVALMNHEMPLLIIHGDEEGFLPMSDFQNFRRINEDSKMVILPETSHRFMKPGQWDAVLDLTRDWFLYEQVLLCDWE